MTRSLLHVLWLSTLVTSALAQAPTLPTTTTLAQAPTLPTTILAQAPTFPTTSLAQAPTLPTTILAQAPTTLTTSARAQTPVMLATSARAPTTLPSLSAAERWLSESLASSIDPATVGEVHVDARWPNASPDGAGLARRLRAALPTGVADGPGVTLEASVRAGALELSLRVGEPSPHWLRVVLARSTWLPRALAVAPAPSSPSRHVARVPLDAELRRYIAGLPQLSETTVVARAYPLPSRDYVALAIVPFAVDAGAPANDHASGAHAAGANADTHAGTNAANGTNRAGTHIAGTNPASGTNPAGATATSAPSEAGPAELILLRADGVIEAHQLGADATGRVRLRRRGEATLPAAPIPGVGAPRRFGTLTVDGASALAALRDREGTIRIERRGDALVLTPLTDALCPPGSHALADACAAPVDGRDYYASVLLPRVGHPAPARAPTSFYARSRRTIRRTDGADVDTEAVVTPRGRIVVRTGDRVVGLGGYGAAIGLADTDHDGQAEVLTSSDALVGEGDQLRLLRVRADGALRAVWQSEPLEGSVLVAGAGDLDADGVDELLAIEEPVGGGRATLWVVR